MKKFLVVLSLVLLLTAVCTSAMAWVSDPNLKSGGKKLSDYDASSTYNGHYVRDVIVLVAPTCTVPGTARIDTWYTEYDPATETYTKTSTEGPSSVVSIDAGHRYSGGEDGEGWLTMETELKDCTKVAQKRVCEVCGQAETRTKSVAANHTFVVKAVPGKEPTCQQKGWGQSVCAVCGLVNPNNPNPFEIATVDHVYSVKVTDTAETCEAEGKGHWECEFCGKAKPGLDGKVEYFTIPAHTFVPASKEVVDEAATCFKDGKSHKVCSLCGLPERDASNQIVYSVLPKLEHKDGFGNWIVKVPATCQDGLEQRVCGLCGTVETRTIPGGDDHTWVEFFKNTGNCTKDAAGKAVAVDQEKWHRCAVCGKEELIGTEPTMALHQFVADTSKASSNIPPECVGGKDGIEYLKCVACGGTYERKVPALKEHNFGAWVCVVAPGTDGSANGVWERTCTNYHCIEKQTYVGTTAPGGVAPTTAPTTDPAPSAPADYRFQSVSYSGGAVSGQVAHVKGTATIDNLTVRITIYTTNQTFLYQDVAVKADGTFSASAGGSVYAISAILMGNGKTLDSKGMYN